MARDKTKAPGSLLERLLPRAVVKIMPRSLLGRQLLAMTLVLGAGNGLMWLQAERVAKTDAIGGEQRRMLAIARSITPHLDGVSHERMAQAAPGRGAWLSWADAPEDVKSFHDELAVLQGFAELQAPVHTLRIRDEYRDQIAAEPNRPHRKALEFVFTSADTPVWRHERDYRPDMRTAFFDGVPTASEPHADSRGAWVSAYTPLLDENDAVVGVVEVEDRAEALLERLADRQKRHAALMLAIVLLMCVAIGLTVQELSAGLARLEGAAQRMGRGDHNTPVVPLGVKEVTQLARGLEQARQSVALRTGELRAMRDALAEELQDARQKLKHQDRKRRRRFVGLKGKLQVTLEVGGRPMAVRLTDLTFDRIVVSLDRAVALDLAPGMAARVFLVPPDGASPCVLDVRAGQTQLTAEETQITLQPDRPLVLEGLPEDVRRLMSQRRTLRIEPSPDQPVVAAVRRSARLKPVEVRVLNISAGGLKVLLAVPFERFSTWGSYMQVALKIADEPMFHLGALVRNCEPAGDSTEIGLEFDAETTPDLAQHQAKIARWVKDRDRERREGALRAS